MNNVKCGSFFDDIEYEDPYKDMSEYERGKQDGIAEILRYIVKVGRKVTPEGLAIFAASQLKTKWVFTDIPKGKELNHD